MEPFSLDRASAHLSFDLASKHSEGAGRPGPGLRLFYFFFRFLSGACVRAEAATDFTFLGVFLFRRSFPALEATLLDVFSFFAIVLSPAKGWH